MKKYQKIVNWSIVVILLIGLSRNGFVSSNQIIEEVIVLGLTRSDTVLVTRQLPFSVGDLWDESFIELAYLRLKALDIFQSSSLTVTPELTENSGVRVVIQAKERNILYENLIGYVAAKVIDLARLEVNQDIINPFGLGVNLKTTYNWSKNPKFNLVAKVSGAKGMNFMFEHFNFDLVEPVNDFEYRIYGFSETIGMEYIHSVNLQVSSTLVYRKNALKILDESFNQNYIMGKVNFKWNYNGTIKFDYLYGHSLNVESSSFHQGTIDYINEYQIMGNNNFIIGLHGGVTSAVTPINDQFQGGGAYCKVPMRGHRKELIGNRYMTSTWEFKREILPKTHLITFFDIGKFAKVNESFKDASLLVDWGIGVDYDISFGLPIRVDVAYNFHEKKVMWSIGMGHSYKEVEKL